MSTQSLPEETELISNIKTINSHVSRSIIDQQQGETALEVRGKLEELITGLCK